jgi:SpoVK/Ycf46/Vps4 family AAA+-type ATPase
MNPTEINKYNNFLSTLEQKKNTKIEQFVINPEKNKKNIDDFIENVKKDFKNNYLSSPFFTGQTLYDKLITNMQLEDPNISNEIIFKNDKPNKPNKHSKVYNDSKELRDKKVRQFINVDDEINNIKDVLKIIEKYKVDPYIKYNIDIRSLHEIKEPLEELDQMIGMNDLKNNIVEQILYFVQELHKNKNSEGDFMHTVIYGPPGTGKTEIAKIMGKIYSKINVLSKGTFKKVTRSDLIAGYLGQTALKTRDVIKSALGGVLFIDEAYALGNPEKRDSFAKECIDTLCEALSDNKSDLMVIIAGYENELNDCFFNYNDGLDSRFTWRFKMDDYSYEDLYNIFSKKVRDIGWEIHENSGITIEWFKKNKEHFKCYGRDIENILAKTKIAHSKRVFCKPENEKKKINLKDLENGFKKYLKNENVKTKNSLETKKYLMDTMYS